MRKNVTLPAVLVFAFSCLMVMVQVSEAQHTQDGQGFPIAGPLSVISPSNATYNSSLLALNVTSKFLLTPNFAEFCYNIDDENNITLPIEATFVPIEAVRTYANGTTEKCISSIFSYHRLNGNVLLPRLSAGSHRLAVYARYQANHITGLDATTVYFTVDDTPDSSAVVADEQYISPSEAGTDSSTDQGHTLGVPSKQSPLTTETFALFPLGAVLTAAAVVAVSILVCSKKSGTSGVGVVNKS